MTTDPGIAYVDSYPTTDDLIVTAAHVHVRGSDRCVKRRSAPLCENDLGKLRRWKAEALPVLAGLQELGEALGLPLGTRITGQEAAKAAERLEAEVASLRARLAAVEALAVRLSRNDEMAEAGRDYLTWCSEQIRAALTAPADEETP
jgi:hypothetical protein